MAVIFTDTLQDLGSLGDVSPLAQNVHEISGKIGQIIGWTPLPPNRAGPLLGNPATATVSCYKISKHSVEPVTQNESMECLRSW